MEATLERSRSIQVRLPCRGDFGFLVDAEVYYVVVQDAQYRAHLLHVQ